MNLIRNYVLFTAGLFFAATAFSQKRIHGIVKDYHSDERVPFASVSFQNTTIGKLTDSAGTFSFYLDKWPSDTLLITCVGFQPFKLYIPASKDTILIEVPMERGTFNEGVRVKTKVNKGLLLWRKIVQHKSKNDRYRFQNFSYELYNKLELDIKNLKFGITKLKPFKPVNDIINQYMDTVEGHRFLPTYLTETISDYYYQKKPLKRREVIKAVNTNGIKNESLIQFLGGMDQNINVYNNFIPVFDKQFVSPASDNGDLYYNYSVKDTQIIGNNRYYHLVFTPRRNGTSTFEGDCWVHAGTFAIQKMNMRLGKDANINHIDNLSLIQEYSLINDSTWFLAKDKFVADGSLFGKDRPGAIGRKTTTYRHVVVNDSSVINALNNNRIIEEVVTLPGAPDKGKAYWDTSRHEQLTSTERGIIAMIDTLRNAPEFKKLTRTIEFIATGYLDIGNFQIGPWFNWLTGNSQEGFRMRFDLGSNKGFDKHWWWHGYLAYGFGDKKFKGKGELFYLPKKHPRLYLYGSYIQDFDYGQNYYGEVSTDNIFALAVRKPNIPIKFLKTTQERFEFFNETRSGFSTLLAATHKNFLPVRNLISEDSFPVTGNRSPLATTEVSLRIRFAYLEKFLENTFFRTSLGSPYPIGEIYVSRGIAGVFKSNYNYTKVSASISDYVKIPPYGNLSFQVYGGKTFGTLPYVLLDIAPGNELYYYNKYAFNTMNKYEFIHDKFAGVNIEHNVGSGIFRLIPKLKFRQFWTAKALWGSLSDANYALNFKQGNNFQTLNGKTYLEVGTGIDNILKVFRIDFVWRLLPTPLPTEIDRKFGIFGSFRLSF
ncbi:MAG: hypothetical protein JWM28_1957 [Chitinophagaceae bacterium]|nr:hypothetical protein [Chitinophagaceae bacterium]